MTNHELAVWIGVFIFGPMLGRLVFFYFEMRRLKKRHARIMALSREEHG